MGLIKTGLTLAGGYGLIKAASKAANEYEGKKQKRQHQTQPQNYPPQQYHPGYEPQMSYMYANQTNNTPPQPGWRAPYESQPVYGGQMSHANPQTQARAIEPQAGHVQHMGGAPPRSYPGHESGVSGGMQQTGTAHEYYSGKPF